MRRQRGGTGAVRLVMQGLNASVTGNAQAFGFSVTVTVTFGVVSTVQSSPALLELVGFAVSAVAAFAVVNAVITGIGTVRQAGQASTRALVIGTATDFLSVGAGVGAAIGLRVGIHGWALWLVAPFVAGLCYVLVQSVELAVGQREVEQENPPSQS